MQAAIDGYRYIIADARFTSGPQRVALMTACDQLGVGSDGLPVLIPGVWEAEVDYDTPRDRAREGWRFYIGQIEGAGQYDRNLGSIASFRVEFPNLPAAIVTNMGGFEESHPGAGREKARPFIDAGYACICEGHINEDGKDPRSRVEYAERVLGWPRPQPMYGLGNNATLADYPGYEDSFGWSVFTAERLYGAL